MVKDGLPLRATALHVAPLAIAELAKSLDFSPFISCKQRMQRDAKHPISAVF